MVCDEHDSPLQLLEIAKGEGAFDLKVRTPAAAERRARRHPNGVAPFATRKSRPTALSPSRWPWLEALSTAVRGVVVAGTTVAMGEARPVGHM